MLQIADETLYHYRLVYELQFANVSNSQGAWVSMTKNKKRHTIIIYPSIIFVVDRKKVTPR